MPGILGFITRNPDTEDNEAQLSAMLHSMVHEPFYVRGTYTLPEFGVYLGWVAHPEQFVNWNPVVDTTGDRLLLFSGEHLAPDTDGRQAAAEFLRTAPEQRAPFLTHLNGWFAGVSVDRREGRVALFNDRYALHRLYVHANADSFVFASEAKALLGVRPETRRLDP